MGFFSRKRAPSTTKPAAKDEHECCKEKATKAAVSASIAPQAGAAVPKTPAGGCCGGKHEH